MNEVNFKEAQAIASDIEKTETLIRKIEELLSSRGVSCEITGTPQGRFNREISYHSRNFVAIYAMLREDMALLQSELVTLKSEFEKL